MGHFLKPVFGVKPAGIFDIWVSFDYGAALDGNPDRPGRQVFTFSCLGFAKK